MKISIDAPMKGEQIKELICGYTENGVSFEFQNKVGIRYIFEADGIEKDAAIDLCKKMIRGTDYGKVLYFSVTAD
jgi:hypothetical protein